MKSIITGVAIQELQTKMFDGVPVTALEHVTKEMECSNNERVVSDVSEMIQETRELHIKKTKMKKWKIGEMSMEAPATNFFKTLQTREI